MISPEEEIKGPPWHAIFNQWYQSVVQGRVHLVLLNQIERMDVYETTSKPTKDIVHRYQ